VALNKISVLITGESGAWKEKLAQAIHYKSRRSEWTMLRLNCAALPGVDPVRPNEIDATVA
jgi:transcriptional regulator with PAS, ATPase and Fis domain